MRLLAIVLIAASFYACMCMVASCARAPDGNGAASAAAPPAITIVAGPGSSEASPTFAHVDFGTRPAGPQAPLAEEYEVRNNGKMAVSVTVLQPSCKCTSGQIIVGGNAVALPADLKAGEAAAVVVTVRLSILKPGPVDKFLSVRTAGSSWPAVTFEITGTLTAAPGDSPGQPAGASNGSTGK